MPKRPINWTDIKERFLLGEAPRTIAGDYKNPDSRKITAKASRDSWKEQKETKRHIISEACEARAIENIFLLGNGFSRS